MIIVRCVLEDLANHVQNTDSLAQLYGVLMRQIFFLFRRGPIIVTELTTTPTLSAIVEFKNKESLEKVNKSLLTFFILY